MEQLVSLLNYIKANIGEIAIVYASLVTIATWIVKLTPTLKDDNVVLPVIKFISKWIAANTPTPEERPK
jgi:hypothetical protein